ncbi:nuclear export mediator factor NEMF [Nematocida sp. AWRm77]|nr:nuclear export mediator factor NEMF [Nematocida sp. AWRm77]
MKGRLSWLDIRAGVNEAQKLLGAHIKTVYSTSKKAILIKFSNKEQLLIDPPSKFHLTYVEHSKINLTPIAIFLRKALSNCRVEKIKQLGFDRIAIIQLGSGEGPLFLIIEMYANGNIILADKDMKIINLLRPVDHLGIEKEETYLINEPSLVLDLDRFEFVTGETLQKKMASFLSLSGRVVEDVTKSMEEHFAETLGMGVPLTLQSISEQKEKNSTEFTAVFNAFFEQVLQKLSQVENYGCVAYDGARPVSFTPWECTSIQVPGSSKEFPSFSEAMDLAFAEPEVQEMPAEKKHRRIRESQLKSLNEKKEEAAKLKKKANLLTEHQDGIREAVQIVQHSVSTGISEEDFLRFKKESEGTSPTAQIIKQVSFAKKTLLLEIEGQAILISYEEGLFEQITNLFQQAKKIEEKAVKARAALEESIRKNEEVQKKAVKIEKIERPVFWFEKFHWFITKDNDVIIGGRDAKQNEILVKKHLADSDHYFHAEIQGGSSVIVGEGATEETKQIAAYFALCLSKAWASGVVVPVYSVRGSQISKTAPAGEYLKHGSFMMTGKKEFYHPYKLEYGFSLVYKLKGREVATSDDNRKVEGFVHPSELTPDTSAEIEYILPVAGPYKYLDSPKYRILPGSSKKGMIIKELLALAEEELPSMVKYIRNISSREMELCIPSNCKLAQAELTKRGSKSVFAKKTKSKKDKSAEKGENKGKTKGKTNPKGKGKGKK